MRVFENLTEAALEIKRDLYKSPLTTSTRVQNREGMSAEIRETLGYSYAVLDGIPFTAKDLVAFGEHRGFPLYVKQPVMMEEWLKAELYQRLFNAKTFGDPSADFLNPALVKTLEGETFSYTYRERLVGIVDTTVEILNKDPDSRRAYWLVYHPGDVMRAASPTRIPCSIGYQFLIRKVAGMNRLVVMYQERSCDFDHFWLSDVWFAHRIRNEIASRLGIQTGALMHQIVSFHSFFAEGVEVY